MNFSPSGDYFTSSGNDSVVMIWKSNLNEFEQELIDDFGGKTSVLPTSKSSAPVKREQAAVSKPVGKPADSTVGKKLARPATANVDKTPAAKQVIASTTKDQ